MNKEEIFDAYQNQRVSLNDIFVHGCLGCGQCCHDIDIVLNAYDLYRLAVHFQTTTEEIIRKYCYCHIGANSQLPVVWLAFDENTKSCPFLDGKRCSVHEIKPGVCASYPFGRGYEKETDKVVYFIQKISCGHPFKKQTVKEWIYGNKDVAYEEESYIVWNKMVLELCRFMQEVPEELKEILGKTLLALFYTNYDINQDFLMQLKERAEAAKKVIEAAKEVMKEIAEGELDDGKM